MSNAVALNHRSSPAKKKSYADVANSSSKSTPSSSANAFIPSEVSEIEVPLGSVPGNLRASSCSTSWRGSSSCWGMR